MIILSTMLQDNLVLPFKGPFKGKGANRRAEREALAALESIHDEMTAMVDRFEEIYPRPPGMVDQRPVKLRKLKRRRNHRLLVWRLPGNSGSFINLFDPDSDKARAILGIMGQYTLRTFMQFERDRLQLNFLSKVQWNYYEAYQVYNKNMDQLVFDQHGRRQSV